jgi:rhamnulokinase
LDVLALDLGASSGRAVLGRFDGERLRLSEVHRFPNGPVALPDGLHWNVLGLWTEVKEALARASRAPGVELSGVGVDTWGLDFGLLDRDGRLLGNPHHYRDPRTDGMIEEAFRRVPRRELYDSTGVQFMQGNTLYQLLSMVESGSTALDAAETLLTMPDLFNYWLTGRKASEFTNATTTQCYDPRRREWAWGMLLTMGLPTRIFTEIVPPGTVLGELSPKVAEEVGAGRLPVIAPACHDTGSAVAAVPAVGGDHAWISSGTWSIVGVDVPSPVIDERSLASELANEGGADGGFRLCKNVTGLWLVQECRRTWALQGRDRSYDELTRLAAEAPALR